MRVDAWAAVKSLARNFFSQPFPPCFAPFASFAAKICAVFRAVTVDVSDRGRERGRGRLGGIGVTTVGITLIDGKWIFSSLARLWKLNQFSILSGKNAPSSMKRSRRSKKSQWRAIVRRWAATAANVRCRPRVARRSLRRRNDAGRNSARRNNPRIGFRCQVSGFRWWDGDGSQKSEREKVPTQLTPET